MQIGFRPNSFNCQQHKLAQTAQSKLASPMSTENDIDDDELRRISEQLVEHHSNQSDPFAGMTDKEKWQAAMEAGAGDAIAPEFLQTEKEYLEDWINYKRGEGEAITKQGVLEVLANYREVNLKANSKYQNQMTDDEVNKFLKDFGIHDFSDS